MRRRTALIAMLPILALASQAWAQRVDPGIDLDRLQATVPAWQFLESGGDPREGHLVAEQSIWPLFYLHWRPLKGKAGRFGPADASQLVEGLWKDQVIDSSLEPQAISMPAHPGFVMESTTSRGEVRSRWYVWACPESGRVFVADTNLSLIANAPPDLLDWQRDMARTVVCHEGAATESFEHLRIRHEDEALGIAYVHPFTWRPVESYRIQEVFGGTDFAASRRPGSTRESGQDLVVAVDAQRRIEYRWGPPPQGPMNFDVLRKTVQDFWRERATNFMMTETRVSNDVWIADGVIRAAPGRNPLPPTGLHKFRAWMWRTNDLGYFAVADIGGIQLGRNRPALTPELWNLILEEMFQAIRY